MAFALKHGSLKQTQSDGAAAKGTRRIQREFSKCIDGAVAQLLKNGAKRTDIAIGANPANAMETLISHGGTPIFRVHVKFPAPNQAQVVAEPIVERN
jgi:hypothetical protein